MQKTFENEGGNILVRKNEKFGCGIVEMLHLYSENKSGCAIACWRQRRADGRNIAEFVSVDDRFITTKYSFDIFEALRYGQKLAEVILESI